MSREIELARGLALIAQGLSAADASDAISFLEMGIIDAEHAWVHLRPRADNVTRAMVDGAIAAAKLRSEQADAALDGGLSDRETAMDREYSGCGLRWG